MSNKFITATDCDDDPVGAEASIGFGNAQQAHSGPSVVLGQLK